MKLFKKKGQNMNSEIPAEENTEAPVTPEVENKDSTEEVAESAQPQDGETDTGSAEANDDGSETEEKKETVTKKKDKSRLPLLLVDRGAKLNGAPGIVKGIVAMGAILAVYSALIVNILEVSSSSSSDAFKILIILVVSGLLLALLPMAVLACSGCRNGERAIAIGAATGMLMVFADFAFSPSPISLYFGESDMYSFGGKEFILICATTLGAVLANYYATLRENTIVYYISWVILIAIAVAMLYFSAYVFMNRYEAGLGLNEQAILFYYPLTALYYLLIVVAFIIARPPKVLDCDNIPSGYQPVFVGSDHERKSDLLKHFATTTIWCSLLFILSGLLIYFDEDFASIKEFVLYFLIIPFVVSLVIAAVVLKSEPNKGPASHAAKYVPIILIWIGILNLIFYYTEENIAGGGSSSYLIMYVLSERYSDLFSMLGEYLEITDFDPLFFATVALLFVSAAGMLVLKKYTRYISILALISLMFMVMNTQFDILRILLVADTVFDSTSPKLFAIPLSFGYVFNLLSILFLMGTVVTKCDYLQVRAETDPVITLDDVLNPKPIACAECTPQGQIVQAASVQQPQQQYAQPTPAQTVAFCPGCGKSLSGLADGLVFCPYCGRALPKQAAPVQQQYAQPTPAAVQAPANDSKDYEITESVKYIVHVRMPKKVLKGHYKYDRLEFTIGGETYRGQIGKTRDIRLNGGTYKFVFRQINYGESPTGNMVNTTVTVCRECTITVEISNDGKYGIVVE